MRRTVSAFESQPQPLLRLCRHRKWDMVLERLESNPSEAAPAEAAWRGEKSTLLACALRIGGAPYTVMEALIRADPRQLLVCHRFAGSIIHEALRSMAADDIFDLVFTRALRQQQESVQKEGRRLSNSNRGGTPSAAAAAPQFQCIHVQEHHRVVRAPNLLQVQDDIGRTVLHQIVEQVARRRIVMGRPAGSTLRIFKQIIEAHPNLVHVTDSDGNTPLVLLLSQNHHTDNHMVISDAMLLEDEIFQMVEYLTTHYPPTVAHLRRMHRPWRFMNLPLYNNATMNGSTTTTTTTTTATTATTTTTNNSTRPMPASSPLYFAILYGRSPRTIAALLRAHAEIGMNGCTGVVTHHGETCLHVAVTLRASLSVLRLLVQADPRAVHAADIYGLTPIDWLWMTHVFDHNNGGPGDLGGGLRLSRRRHVGRDFREWHEMVTDRIPYQADRFDFLEESTVARMQMDFLARLKVMLSAAYSAEEGQGTTIHGNTSGGLLPLICRINNLPVGILKLVLAMDPLASSDAKTRDASGCYPLHHIARHTRGYRVSLPLGVTNLVQILTETKETLVIGDLVDRFPAACRAANYDGQLPLHVAIDASKADRNAGEAGCDDQYNSAVVETLLETYPEALYHRDGITRLLPWQQAAAGRGASLDTVYDLLRREPAFLSSVASP